MQTESSAQGVARDLEADYKNALQRYSSRHLVLRPPVSQRRLDFEYRRPQLLRECIAEAVGVFIYVFPGFASIASINLNITSPTVTLFGSLFQVGLAFGVGIALAITVCAPVSGGHFNPGVTLCFAVWGGFPWRKVPLFILSQIFGAFMAGIVLMGCYWPQIQTVKAAEIAKSGSAVYNGGAGGILCPFPPEDQSNLGYLMLQEFVGSALLSMIIWSCVDLSNPFSTPVSLPYTVGLAFAVIIWGFGSQSLSMNSARDLGPRIVTAIFFGSEAFTYKHFAWIPILVNIPGYLLGAGFYEYVFRDSARSVQMGLETHREGREGMMRHLTNAGLMNVAVGYGSVSSFADGRNGKDRAYEVEHARKRRNVATSHQGGPASAQKRRIESLTAEVQSLKSQITQSSPLSREVSERKVATPAPKAVTQDTQVLSPDDLAIPVTAVHVMIHPSPNGQPQRNMAGWTPSNQSQWHREEYGSKDLAKRDLFDDAQARRLFSDFMQQCNTATPIFDPVLDTYESIRELYPRTLNVILWLAARQDLSGDKTLEQEVRCMVGQTLFENPCSLDGLEAMLLLSVHSEKMWFALGHTHQMALDLRLQACMENVLAAPDDCSRADSQYARLWLFVVYFDRALAIGGARWPRCDRMDPTSLEAFAQRRYSHPSDIFFCASLEIFDFSASLRLRPLSELPDILELDNALDQWFSKWDGHYDKQCVHESSLQRIHLKIQLLLAKTWQLAIVLVRLLHSPDQDERTCSLPVHILRTEHELFEFISQSDAYRRYFPWSPTYEVLLLTFTVIVGLKVLSMYPDPRQQERFKDAAFPIAALLQKHPLQHFSRVIDTLLQALDNSGDPVTDNNFDGMNLDWIDGSWNFDAQFDGLFGDWARDFETVS
ncbi:hypothetical protein PRZ48_006770 [Zasmidium cellare]|uniref:Transcription factor domain-containing protein n=1 Tax=Zasmidium cellare TaxID=395010 RepID=A0ABR0EHK5_ZASCE|nr:hypothetical protein PRZ48_006770 [Zasmidium cellare]